MSYEEAIERHVPALVRDRRGQGITLNATVARSLFQRLIKSKVERTIECCHEALARAKDKADVQLGAIDYVILVGGSSRVPMVRETVKAAFCNPALAVHVRHVEPLLHEPDLCVAYGAALRAATYGVRYVYDHPSGEVELKLTSPSASSETHYHMTGIVRCGDDPRLLDGGSVRIRALATGLSDEAFLDARGTFGHDVELIAETDNLLELTLCDGIGNEISRVSLTIRHQANSRRLGQGVLPTQLITKPLQIEVLNRVGQRMKQVVAPIGSPLPGTFQCICRTHDQSGRILVPIFEENRVVKEMVIEDLDTRLPVGSPVEVELAIDVKHVIEVTVRLRHGTSERVASATIGARRPSHGRRAPRLRK